MAERCACSLLGLAVVHAGVVFEAGVATATAWAGPADPLLEEVLNKEQKR